MNLFGTGVSKISSRTHARLGRARNVLNEGAPNPVGAFFCFAPKWPRWLVFRRNRDVQNAHFGDVMGPSGQKLNRRYHQCRLSNDQSLIFGALTTDQLYKRLLGYSSIANVGYALGSCRRRPAAGRGPVDLHDALLVSSLGLFAGCARDAPPGRNGLEH